MHNHILLNDSRANITCESLIMRSDTFYARRFTFETAIKVYYSYTRYVKL